MEVSWETELPPLKFKMKIIAFAALAAASFCSASAQDGDVPLAVYRPGDLPIILSMPHGGFQDVPSIPDRVDGCPVEGADPEADASERCDFALAHEDPTCRDGDLCYASVVTDSYTIDVGVIVARRCFQLAFFICSFLATNVQIIYHLK